MLDKKVSDQIVCDLVGTFSSRKADHKNLKTHSIHCLKRSTTMDCQDWETVKVGSKARKTPVARPAHTAGTKALRALDDMTDVKPAKTLSPESRAEIVRLSLMTWLE